MLVALRIENFILIDELELRLEPGYNVLTGETGAGKSIVVGALDLVLGGRASADVVRPGAAQAEVEALFDVGHSAELTAALQRADLASGSELVIRRVVQATGRSRAYANGRLCTARQLGELAPQLADITSQHESAAMADPRRHLDYLDRFGGLLERRVKLGAVVEELRDVGQQIRELRERERTRAEREAFLHYQLETINALSPRPGELDQLQAERTRLKHAEQLHALSAQAASRLDEADDALCDTLGRLGSQVAAAAELDGALGPVAAELQDCWSRLREAATDLARYAERIEADPDRLEQVQDRIFRLEGLLRQHGPRIEDVLEAQSRIEGELAELAESHSRLPELERHRARLEQRAAKRARQLSARRHEAAQSLGEAISAELALLGMGKARVEVEVKPAANHGAELTVDGARLGRFGIDQVQFLIAPNRGMEPRPLGRIASGGELSRALLAAKRALGGYEWAAQPDERTAGIQVFDEVDAGVGGATADKIGQAIADIARHRQVLCITHLAPIAAYATTHYVVTKREQPSGTTSSIEPTRGKPRAAELARMLTGQRITGSTTKAATELLAAARRWTSRHAR